MRIHHKTLFASLLLASTALSAQAEERCKFSANRDLNLNLAGVKIVAFDIGPYTLDIEGGASNAGTVRGKACASSAKRLEDLIVTQTREGDRLVVRAGNRSMHKLSWSGGDYSNLTLVVALPSAADVRVDVGSGEASIANVASLAGDVGSGELHASGIRGTFFADVGSGEIEADGIGALHVVSVGSGDLVAKNVGGDARVDEIGSGDVRIVDAAGDVRIGTIGSGDADVSGIAGKVVVERLGSGDLNVARVRGGLTVDRVGSGSVQRRDIDGPVRVPHDD